MNELIQGVFYRLGTPAFITKISVCGLLFFLLIHFQSAYGQNGNCVNPCPYNVRTINRIDTTLYEFDTLLLRELHTIDENTVQYFGDTIGIKTGVIYKFNVKAGYAYGWHTDVSRSINDHIKTKLTLFYDDFETPITASNGSGSLWAQKLEWRANYTGVVGIMVTRGEEAIGPNGCGFNEEPIKMRFYCIEEKGDRNLVFGRYSDTLYVPCGTDTYIYSSGLDGTVEGASNIYSDNEDGYIVLYPEDETARLKIWGEFQFYIEQDNTGLDTLFIYNGVYPTNYSLLAYYTTFGAISEDDPVITSIPNAPMSIRMKSNGSCTFNGVVFTVTCCIDPGMPPESSMLGEMINDTSAVLSWEAAIGSENQYSWTLFDENDNFIAHDSTYNTSDTVFGLTCNTNYYFIITVASTCSNIGGTDTIRSELFNFPYAVTLNSPPHNGGCVGNEVSVTANLNAALDPTSVLWEWESTGNEFSVGENGSQISIDSMSQSTTISVTATSLGGCVAAQSINLAIFSLPTLNLNPNAPNPAGNNDSSYFEICNGECVTLNMTGASNYVWSDGNNGRFRTFCPTETTLFSVTGTDFHDCTSSQSFLIKVNPIPIIEISAPTTACLWDSITIAATGAQHYSFYKLDTLRYDSIFVSRVYSDSTFRYDTLALNRIDTVLIRVDTITIHDTIHIERVINILLYEGFCDSIRLQIIDTRDYLIVGIDSNGCVGRHYWHITKLPLPIITGAVSPQSACAGDEILLKIITDDPTHSYRYSWWKDDRPDLILSTSDSLTDYPESTSTYFVNISTVDNCDTTITFQLPVHPLPVMAITALPEQVCSGEQSVLTAFGNNVVSWLWDNTYSGNPYSVYPTTPTTYHVVATNVYGCKQVDSVTVGVNPAPIPEKIDSSLICLGDSVTITTSGNYSTYQWAPSLGLSATTGSSVVAFPSVSTEYRLIYHNEYNCYDTTAFFVEVYVHPDITVSNDTTICRGDTIALIAHGSQYYQWNDAANSISDTLFVSPSDNQTYHVIGYEHPNCFSEATIQVNVIPYFNLSITSTADSVCEGGQVSFTAGGGVDYLWNGHTSGNTITLNFDTTTIISLKALNDETNCSYTVYDTVSVIPLPEFTILQNQTSYCALDTLTLYIENNEYQYLWSNGSHDNHIRFFPTAGDYGYTVTATNFFGCTQTESIQVTINPPAADFNINLSSDTLCFDERATVSVSIPSTEIVEHYLWNIDYANDGNSFTYIPSIASTTPYNDTITVTVVNQFGCLTTASAIITINPIPKDTIISSNRTCVLDTIWFYASGDNFYHWGSPIASIYSQNDSVYYLPTIANPSKQILLDVTNQYGCMLSLRKTFAIDTLPNVAITSLHNGNVYCNTSFYTFTAHGAESYSWNNGMSGNPISFTPTVSLITVTGTDGNGCVGKANSPIQLIITPEPFINISDTTICALQPFVLEGSSSLANAHFLWSTGITDNTLIVDTLSHSQRYVLECYVTYNGVRCSQFDTAYVAVNPLPVIVPVSNSPTCANNIGQIRLSGANVYQWDPNAALLYVGDSSMVNVIASNENAGDTMSFTVVGTNDTTGCRSRLSIPYIFTPPPTINILTNLTGNAICEGDSAILYASGADSYQWSIAGHPDLHGISDSIIVSPSAATTYQLIGKIMSGCSDTAQVTITVHPNPTAAITAATSSVCLGDSTILSVNSSQTNTDFLWVNNQNSDSLRGTEVMIYPTQTTQYRVMAMNELTSCQGDTTIFITVHPLPEVAITGQNGICLGNSVTLSSSGAISYQWFDEDGNIIGITSAVNVSPTNVPHTTYTVLGTDQNGCIDTATKAITVAVLPEIEIMLSNPGYLCADNDGFIGAVIIGNHDEMHYTWSSIPIDSGLVFLSNIAFLSPDTTTTYTINADFDNLDVMCAAEFTQIVEVFPNPTITVTTEMPSVCNDLPINISVTGASNYLWISNTDSIISTDSIFNLIPTQTSTYYIFGKDDRGCTDSDSITITVEDHHPVDSLLSNTVLCSNTPTEIILTGENSYQWFPSVGLSNFTDSSVVVTATEPITYTVVYTNIYGCSDSLLIPITILDSPNLNLPSDTTICEGNDITIRVSGATSYEWENGNTNNYFSFAPTEDTTFTVTGFLANGCSSTAAITIHVVSLFDLAILSTEDTVCENLNQVILTAYGAGDSYLWSTGETTPVITVTPSQSTSYSLTAYNVTNGCHHTVEKTVSVIELPSFAISAIDSFICIHDSMLLFTNSSNHYSYLWSTGDRGDTIVVSPQASTAYSVLATDFFGCQATALFNLAVYPLPTVQIIADDTSSCVGNNVHLSVVGNGISYLWNNGETTQEITISNEIVNTYTVKAFSEYGCTASDEQMISIYPQPTDTLILVGSIICAGDSVILSSTGANHYLWSPANTLSSDTAPTVYAFPDTTTEYQVIFSNQFGCTDSATLTVEVLPVVNLLTTPDTIICVGASVQLAASNGITYLWNTGSTDNMITVTPEQNTTYSVTATNEYLCAASHIIHVNVVPSFELNITASQDTICLGDSILFQYSGGADFIEWNTSETSATITVYPTETAIYSLHGFNYTANCGKTIYDTITVIPYPIFEVTPHALVCANQQVTIFANSPYYFEYHWYAIPDDSIVVDEEHGTIMVTPTTTTTYYYEATNSYCALTDSTTIEIARDPILQYDITEDVCEQCLGAINLSAATDYMPVHYLLNDTLVTDPITNLCSGLYNITVVDSLGCASNEIVIVGNSPPPSFIVSQIISEVDGQDGRIILDSLIANGNYLIQVYDETLTTLIYEGTEVTISNVASGNYWVQLTDQNCSYGIFVNVPPECNFEVPIYIPNAICTDCPTANYWKPLIADYENRDYDIEFWIYNRWGHLVYQGNDYEKGWDGSHNWGNPMFHKNQENVQGVYTYVLIVKLNGTNILKKVGSINVIVSNQ